MYQLNCIETVQEKIDKSLLSDLSCFQRILLVTDGTVTNMLEQYLDDSIKAYKLYECIENRIDQLPQLHQRVIGSNDLPVLQRKILLQGQATLTNWVYAESSLLLNNIPSEFRQELFASNEPIGNLWSKYQTETYKIILEAKRDTAGGLAEYFNIQPDDEILSRTYKVNSENKMTMLITEKFPVCFFLD